MFGRNLQNRLQPKLVEFNDGGIGGIAGAIDGYTYPRAWYEGLVAAGLGQRDAAKKAFESALRAIEDDERVCASDEKSRCLLGLIHAELGNTQEALSEARRAVALVPISNDAFDGPILSTNLAVVYAKLGDLEAALTELERLAKLPNGPTPGLLRVEPEWDPLRNDPRFKALISNG